MSSLVVGQDSFVARHGAAWSVTLCCLLFPLWLAGDARGQDKGEAYVRVSPRDPRYFELSDGRPYIPIGLNMIAPPGGSEKESLAGMDAWMRKLSENGGNYIRLWLSNPFFDVEHARSGVYDEAKARRIESVLAMARKYHIRVKMTLEHFRHLGDGRQRWAAKSILPRTADPPRTSPISSPIPLRASSSKRNSTGTRNDLATTPRSSPGNSGTSSMRSRACGNPRDGRRGAWRWIGRG
jgi:hypothetical protein